MPVPAGTALRAAGTAAGTGLRRAYAQAATVVHIAAHHASRVPVPVSVHPQAIDLSQLMIVLSVNVRF